MGKYRKFTISTGPFSSSPYGKRLPGRVVRSTDRNLSLLGPIIQIGELILVGGEWNHGILNDFPKSYWKWNNHPN